MPSTGSRRRNYAPRFPRWAEFLICVFALVLLASAYVGAMHLSIDNGAQVDGEATNGADALYFGLHGVLVVGAIAVGILLAGFMRRSAFAIGALAAAWLVSVMLLAQVATFHLACEGTNDIIRHWQCEVEQAEE